MSDDALHQFWELAKVKAKLNRFEVYVGATPLSTVLPPAWAFGATPQEADDLLALVLAGTKTATAGALDDYDAEGEPLPTAGTLSIVLDGAGNPRALIETTRVDVVAFDQVDAEHAFLEGEDDRSLESWRRIHERFFTEHADHDLGFRPDMPIVLERFRVIYPTPANA
ncbi:MAG: ASCH domain-containing protein [Actinobacteria bacterium]|uniref:ASCH domain-containing protein n=1 Tax=Nostocoides veronense TaxID=330836 RepID=A0ABN2LR94_9MICO|nr:ASCH domain-containing protein [Actinomycetota bacterium]